MKVTVTKYLNVRVGAPSVNAPCYNYLAPGSVIEVEEKTVPGDSYNDNNQWYKGFDGSYYWSGGVMPPTGLPALEVHSNYNTGLLKNIPPALSSNKGKGVVVTVLDTGIYQAHPDLANAFDPANFPAQNYSDSLKTDDMNGHGTHVAGLIGGRGNKPDSVTGVAPACILQSIKVLRDDGSEAGTYIEKGLNAVSPKTDLINMSLSVTVDEYGQMLALVDKLSKTAVLICAAGSNEELLQSTDALYCPACSPNVISVGVITDDFVKNNPGAVFNPNLDYILPQMDLRSTSLESDGSYKNRNGSSMATALVSGLAALVISAARSQKTVVTMAFVKSQLDIFATKYSSAADLSTLTLLKS